MTATTPAGHLLVVSGPGGVGKGTVVAALRGRNPDVEVSVSATTRAMRPGEVDGQHYHFVTPAEFQRMVDHDEFLEWAEFNGNRYGTPWSSVTDRLADGATVVLEIDVQGAMQIRRRAHDVGDIRATLVFIQPPDYDTLEARLRQRGSEDEDTIAARLRIGREEMDRAREFDRAVVNDRLDAAVEALERILRDPAEG